MVTAEILQRSSAATSVQVQLAVTVTGYCILLVKVILLHTLDVKVLPTLVCYFSKKVLIILRKSTRYANLG